MRFLSTTALFMLALLSFGQYGTYDASKANAVSGSELVVLLTDAESPSMMALKTAVKNNWKGDNYSFAPASQLGASGFQPGKTYLLHHLVKDPKTFDMNYLSLVEGWKMKKSESINTQGNVLLDIPDEHIIAGILFDPEKVDGMSSVMVEIYVKHLMDYVYQASKGKVTDKTTAERLYQKRTSKIKEGELRFCTEHVDKTMADDQATVMEIYPYPHRIRSMEQNLENIKNPDSQLYISDVVLTGEGKNRHCFKRVFNTASGELVYMANEPSVFGKKEGFLIDDLKSIARSR